MKQKNMSPRYEQILKCYAILPQKILMFHGRDNIVEFVLHTLCDEECLNLSKAAYFINNQDFDCLKGIAGFDKTLENGKSSIWDNPEKFSKHMKECVFNQKVRQTILQSSKRAKSENELVTYLANELSISNPHFYSWDSKYDNRSILVFEPMEDDINLFDKELLKGLCLLGFCPIF